MSFQATWLSAVIRSPRLLYEEKETDIELSGPARATCIKCKVQIYLEIEEIGKQATVV